jgi:hypothetical protein
MLRASRAHGHDPPLDEFARAEIAHLEQLGPCERFCAGDTSSGGHGSAPHRIVLRTRGPDLGD